MSCRNRCSTHGSGVTNDRRILRRQASHYSQILDPLDKVMRLLDWAFTPKPVGYLAVMRNHTRLVLPDDLF